MKCDVAIKGLIFNHLNSTLLHGVSQSMNFTTSKSADKFILEEIISRQQMGGRGGEVHQIMPYNW